MSDEILKQWGQITSDPEYQKADAATKEYTSRYFLTTKKDAIRSLRQKGDIASINKIIATVRGGKTPEQMAEEIQSKTWEGSGLLSPGAHQQFYEGTTAKIGQALEYKTRGRVDYTAEKGEYVPIVKGAETVLQPSTMYQQREQSRPKGYQTSIMEDIGDIAAGAGDIAYNIPAFYGTLAKAGIQGEKEVLEDLAARSIVAFSDPVEQLGSIPVVKIGGKIIAKSVPLLARAFGKAAPEVAQTAAAKTAANISQRAAAAKPVKQSADDIINKSPTVDGYKIPDVNIPAKTVEAPKGKFKAALSGAGKTAKLEAGTEFIQESLSGVAEQIAEQGKQATELKDMIAAERNPNRRAALQKQLKQVESSGLKLRDVIKQGVIGGVVGFGVGGFAKIGENVGESARQISEGQFVDDESQAAIGSGLIATRSRSGIGGVTSKQRRVDKGGYVGGIENARNRTEQALLQHDLISSELADLGAKKAALEQRTQELESEYNKQEVMHRMALDELSTKSGQERAAFIAGTIEPSSARLQLADKNSMAARKTLEQLNAAISATKDRLNPIENLLSDVYATRGQMLAQKARAVAKAKGVRSIQEAANQKIAELQDDLSSNLISQARYDEQINKINEDTNLLISQASANSSIELPEISNARVLKIDSRERPTYELPAIWKKEIIKGITDRQKATTPGPTPVTPPTPQGPVPSVPPTPGVQQPPGATPAPGTTPAPAPAAAAPAAAPPIAAAPAPSTAAPAAPPTPTQAPAAAKQVARVVSERELESARKSLAAEDAKLDGKATQLARLSRKQALQVLGVTDPSAITEDVQAEINQLMDLDKDGKRLPDEGRQERLRNAFKSLGVTPDQLKAFGLPSEIDAPAPLTKSQRDAIKKDRIAKRAERIQVISKAIRRSERFTKEQRVKMAAELRKLIALQEADTGVVQGIPSETTKVPESEIEARKKASGEARKERSETRAGKKSIAFNQRAAAEAGYLNEKRNRLEKEKSIAIEKMNILESTVGTDSAEYKVASDKIKKIDKAISKIEERYRSLSGKVTRGPITIRRGGEIVTVSPEEMIGRARKLYQKGYEYLEPRFPAQGLTPAMLEDLAKTTNSFLGRKRVGQASEFDFGVLAYAEPILADNGYIKTSAGWKKYDTATLAGLRQFYEDIGKSKTLQELRTELVANKRASKAVEEASAAPPLPPPTETTTAKSREVRVIPDIDVRSMSDDALIQKFHAFNNPAWVGNPYENWAITQSSAINRELVERGYKYDTSIGHPSWKWFGPFISAEPAPSPQQGQSKTEILTNEWTRNLSAYSSDAIDDVVLVIEGIENAGANVTSLPINPLQGINATIPADLIEVDPQTYQFKAYYGNSGSNLKLAGVEWDERKAQSSSILVHFRDGKFYVVDGHQRLGIAKAAARKGGKPVNVPAIIVTDANVSSEEARFMGVLHNMQEGTADAIEIARALRVRPLTPSEIATIPKMPGKANEDAMHMVRLDQKVWELVVNESLLGDRKSTSAKQANIYAAAAVGRLFSDPVHQETALKDILSNPRRTSRDDINERADAIKASGFSDAATAVQLDMFGNVVVDPITDYVEELNKAVRRLLSTNRGAFANAARNSEALRQIVSGEGEIDPAVAKQRAQEMDALSVILDIVKNTADFSQARREEATRLKDAKSEQEASRIRQEATERLIGILERELANASGVQVPAKPGSLGGQAQQGGAPLLDLMDEADEAAPVKPADGKRTDEANPRGSVGGIAVDPASPDQSRFVELITKALGSIPDKNINDVQPIKNLEELRLSLESAVGGAVSKMKQLGPLAADVIINSEKKLETKVLNLSYPDYKNTPVWEVFNAIVSLISSGKRGDVLSLLREINRLEPSGLVSKDGLQKRKNVVTLIVLRAMDAASRGEAFSTYEPGRPAVEEKLEAKKPPEEAPDLKQEEDLGSEDDALEAALARLEETEKAAKKPPTPPKPPGGGGGGGRKQPPTPPKTQTESDATKAMNRLGSSTKGLDAFSQLGAAGLGAIAVIGYLTGDPNANEAAMASLAFLTPGQYEFLVKKGTYVVQKLNDMYASTRKAADRIRLDEWIEEFSKTVREIGSDAVNKVLSKIEESMDSLVGMFKGSLNHRKKVLQYVEQNGPDGAEDVPADIPQEIEDANPPAPPSPPQGDMEERGPDGGTGQYGQLGEPVGGDVASGGGEGRGGSPVLEQRIQEPDTERVQEPGGVRTVQQIARLAPVEREREFSELPSSGNENTDYQRREDYESARNSDVVGPYVLRLDGDRIGGRSHPRLIVETRSLQGAPYPELSYDLDPSVLRAVKNGKISIEQADAIAAAGQANDNGHGILIADDVGLGKSREVAGIALDWLNSGKSKLIVIVTKGEQNVEDLFRDQGNPGSDNNYLDTPKSMNLGEFGEVAGGQFPALILRMRGDFLRGQGGAKALAKFKKSTGPKIVVVDSYNFAEFADQIIEMNPDSLIADEAHMFKSTGSKKGEKWESLHRHLLRNGGARFAYLTATPASDISELFYLYGLREWPMGPVRKKGEKKEPGEIDPFEAWVGLKTGSIKEAELELLKDASDRGVISKLPDGLVAPRGSNLGVDYSPSIQEQVVREFKMNGKYIARDLWRGGVVFQAKEISRTQEEKSDLEEFNKIVREIQKLARESVKGIVPEDVRIRASFVFSQIQAASKSRQSQARLRSAVDMAKKALGEGRQPVISVVSVSGEDLGKEPKMTKKQKEELKQYVKLTTGKENGEWSDLSDLDKTSFLRGNLAAAIRAINDRRYEVVIVDGKSQIVDAGPNMKMQEAKARLLKQSEKLKATSDPVELVRSVFGEDNVSVITGAIPVADRQRFVKDFQDGKRRVALISAAGKTGISLHHVKGEPGGVGATAKGADANNSQELNDAAREINGKMYALIDELGIDKSDPIYQIGYTINELIGDLDRLGRVIVRTGNLLDEIYSNAAAEKTNRYNDTISATEKELKKVIKVRDLLSELLADVVPLETQASLLWFSAEYEGEKPVVSPQAGAQPETGVPRGQREMILTDYEWTAPAVKQELGRVDRAGQLTPPILTLIHTGSAAEKKFLATIAGRMAGLGAVSKGQSDSTGTDALSDFEIGGPIDNAAARAALSSFFESIAVNDGQISNAGLDGSNGIELLRGIVDAFSYEPVVNYFGRELDALTEKFREDLEAGKIKADEDGYGLAEAKQLIRAFSSSPVLRSFTVKDLLKELQIMPPLVSFLIYDQFEYFRNQNDAIKQYRQERSTARQSGVISREYKAGDNVFMYDVEAMDNTRFSILSGNVSSKMGVLQSNVPGGYFSSARTYTSFKDIRDNYRITGLYVPTNLRMSVRNALGIKDESTLDTAFRDLMAGDSISLSNGITIRPPKELTGEQGRRLSDEEVVFDIVGVGPRRVSELEKYGAFVDPAKGIQVQIRGRSSLESMIKDIGIGSAAAPKESVIPEDRRVTIGTGEVTITFEGRPISESGEITYLDIKPDDGGKVFAGRLLKIGETSYVVTNPVKGKLNKPSFGASKTLRFGVERYSSDHVAINIGPYEPVVYGKLDENTLTMPSELYDYRIKNKIGKIEIDGDTYLIETPRVNKEAGTTSMTVRPIGSVSYMSSRATGTQASSSVITSLEKEFTAIVSALVSKEISLETATVDAAIIILKKNAVTPQQKRVAELIANGVKKMRKLNIGIDVSFGSSSNKGVYGFAVTRPGLPGGNATENNVKVFISRDVANDVMFTGATSRYGESDSNNQYVTLAHEMIHAITVAELTSNPNSPESKSIKKIFRNLKNYISMTGAQDFGNFYANSLGLSPGRLSHQNAAISGIDYIENIVTIDQYEMLSYIMTDPILQDWLKSINATGEKFGPTELSATISTLNEAAKKKAQSAKKNSIFRILASLVTKILSGIKNDIPLIEEMMNATSSMTYQKFKAGPTRLDRSQKNIPDMDPSRLDLENLISLSAGKDAGGMFINSGDIAGEQALFDALRKRDIDEFADELIKQGTEGLRRAGIVLNMNLNAPQAINSLKIAAGFILKGVSGIRGAIKRLIGAVSSIQLDSLIVKANGVANAIGNAFGIDSATSRTLKAAEGIYLGGPLANALFRYLFGSRFAAQAVSTTPYTPSPKGGEKRLSDYQASKAALPAKAKELQRAMAALTRAQIEGATVEKMDELTERFEKLSEEYKDIANRVAAIRKVAEEAAETITDPAAILPGLANVMAPDPAGINITRLDTDQDVRDFMANLLEETKEWFNEQVSAAPQTFKQWEREAAEKLTNGEITIKDVLEWDYTQNLPTAPQITAARMMLHTMAGKVQKLAVEYAQKKASKQVISDPERFEFMRMVELLLDTSAAVEGSTKGIARALSAHRIFATTHDQMIKDIQAISAGYAGIAKWSGGDAIDNAVSRIAEIESLFDENGKLKMETVKGKQSKLANTIDKLAELWLMNILSAIGTHARNVVGLGMQIGNAFFQAAVASAIGTIKGAPPELRVSLGEISAMISATALGGAEGARVALSTWKSGAPTGPVGQLEAIPSAFEMSSKPVKMYTNILRKISLDVLMATDEGFKTVFYRMSMARYAYRLALSRVGKNASSNDIKQAMEAILTDENMLVVLHDKAVKEATIMAFQDSNIPLVRSLSMLKRQYPLLTFIIPFVRTPVNLIKQASAKMPLIWRLNKDVADKIKAGGVEADLARADIYLGGLQALLIVGLVMAGSMVGHAPDDEDERRRWLESGKVPYSVRIPGTDYWIPYNLAFGAHGLLWGVIADIAQQFKQDAYNRKLNSEVLERQAELMAFGSSALFGLVRGLKGLIYEQSFARGIDDYTSLLKSSDSDPQVFSNLMVALAVPNFVKKIADMDPYGSVEVRGDNFLQSVGNKLQAAIPLARRGLNTPIGVIGPMDKRVTTLGTAGGQTELQRIGSAFLPAVPRRRTKDVVFKELERLNIGFDNYGKTLSIGDDKISFEILQQDRNILKGERGRMAYKILEQIINSPSYGIETAGKQENQGTDFARREAIKAAMTASAKYAVGSYMSKLTKEQVEERVNKAIGRMLQNKPERPY